jgi:hypothetical protein
MTRERKEKSITGVKKEKKYDKGEERKKVPQG